MDTDVSKFASGIVISQYDDKLERSVTYDSTMLSKEQKNYSPTERECPALVWSVSKFWSFLHGNQFILHTDHNPLVWLCKIKQPSGRVAHWIMTLEEYQYKIKYQPDKLHDNADFMSRIGEKEKSENVAQTQSKNTQTEELEDKGVFNGTLTVLALRVAVNNQEELLLGDKDYSPTLTSPREHKQREPENTTADNDNHGRQQEATPDAASSDEKDQKINKMEDVCTAETEEQCLIDINIEALKLDQ